MVKTSTLGIVICFTGLFYGALALLMSIGLALEGYIGNSDVLLNQMIGIETVGLIMYYGQKYLEDKKC